MDDELYFETCLQIRTKDDGIQALKLNSSQRYAHEQIEKQLRETGRVRVIILKGRQQGISTYVGARFYKTVTTHEGLLAFIVTHEDAATQNLFGMTKRYHDHNLPDFKPETGVANANELKFSRLDSGYKIATAGARTAGRSHTIQLAHLSEFDLWPDASADEVFKGIMEAVPNAAGTEVVIESTAKHPGGRFHRAWLAAKKGQSSFIALFIPWFVHDEYRETPPKDWEPPAEFEEYRLLHGLDMEQLYWAWSKNRDMALTYGLGDEEFCIDFKREYPATDEEAFELAGDELKRVIPMAWIKAAQARWIANQDRPLPKMDALGLDVAEGGPDQSVGSPWHGVRLEEQTVIKGVDATDGAELAGAVVSIVRDDAITGIDMGGGWGSSVNTHLKKHLKLKTYPINPAAKATRKSADGRFTFRNMRAQIYWAFREALDPKTGEDLELYPDPELAEDLSAPEFKVTPGGILIESKDDIRVRIGRSPDKGDSAAIGLEASRKGVRALVESQNSRERAGRKGAAPQVNRQYGTRIG